MQRAGLTVLALLIATGIGFAFVKYATRGNDTEVGGQDKTKQVQDVKDGQQSQTASNDNTGKPDTDSADQKTTPQDAVTPQPKPAENNTNTVNANPIDKDAKWMVVEVDQQPEPVIGAKVKDKEENPYMLEAQFTPWGAGLSNLKLSRYSTKVQAFEPYPIQKKLPYGDKYYRYPFAIEYVLINGQSVEVRYKRWAVVAAETNAEQATFELTIAYEQGTPALKIKRTFKIKKERYDLSVSQYIENLSGQQLNVSLVQNGPGDLPYQQTSVGDQRNLTFGYYNLDYDPGRLHVFVDDHHLKRTSVIGQETSLLWPTEETREEKLEMAWASMENRYFAVTMHAGYGPADQAGFRSPVPLEQVYGRVDMIKWGDTDNELLVSSFVSKPLLLNAAGSPTAKGNVNFQVYAGPKERDILINEPYYQKLGLGKLIIYDLGSFCSFCTFAWLAEMLITFLTFIAGLVHDWGFAIICLVIVVRGLLHPLTKRSQINMMKVGKQMQMLQPEIEKLKKKFGDDQQRMNQEMMKLYRERGVNPAAMGLGCLPMMLQMPIWIALYAMLYFAIELRHESAFWGVFQNMGGWSFLADLSSPDQFLQFGDGGINLGLFTLTSFNILPILLALVFYLQQKYMATPAQTPEAQKQQNIMKYMMLLFPIFLYTAPSGLNLYILTSSMTGIIESKRVRAHIKEEEEKGTLFDKKEKKGGCMGGKFMEKVAARMEEQQRALEESKKQQGGGKGGGGRKNRGTKGGKRRK